MMLTEYVATGEALFGAAVALALPEPEKGAAMPHIRCIELHVLRVEGTHAARRYGEQGRESAPCYCERLGQETCLAARAWWLAAFDAEMVRGAA